MYIAPVVCQLLFSSCQVSVKILGPSVIILHSVLHSHNLFWEWHISWRRKWLFKQVVLFSLIGWSFISKCYHAWLPDKFLQGSYKGDNFCRETWLSGDIHQWWSPKLFVLAGPYHTVQLWDKHLWSTAICRSCGARIRWAGWRRSLISFILKYSVINFYMNFIVTTGGSQLCNKEYI